MTTKAQRDEGHDRDMQNYARRQQQTREVNRETNRQRVADGSAAGAGLPVLYKRSNDPDPRA